MRIRTNFAAVLLFSVACSGTETFGPRPPGARVNAVCDTREYSYDPINQVWVDEQSGEILTANPQACAVTLVYPAGTRPDYIDDPQSPVTIVTPAEQAISGRPWLTKNGWVSSYDWGAADQEDVIYSAAQLKEAIDNLRTRSGGFDAAMRAVENDPRNILVVQWGFIADGSPAKTDLYPLNSNGMRRAVVTIDLENLNTFAAKPEVQSHGGANLDVVFAHEIYGHALSWFAGNGDCPDNSTCPITRENRVRDEIGLPHRNY